MDASSKSASGVLEGKIVSFGDYDQCLNINHDIASSIGNGQYCVAEVELSNIVQGSINVSLSEIFPAFNYYHPRYSICMPASCSEKDVVNIINWSLYGSSLKL